MKRKPAFAGHFYPQIPDLLKKELQQFFDDEALKKEVKGIVVPHAGYRYSGIVTGNVFSRIKVPDTFVFIGPNHSGKGEAISIITEGAWETPLGDIDIDSELAEQIVEKSELFKKDTLAHEGEHAIEVQLPFVQYLSSECKFVPIALRSYNEVTCEEVGRAIASAVKKCSRNVIIAASTDMTHYEPAAIARQKDKLAIHDILRLDGEALIQTVHTNDISMCGVGATATMLFACKALGAKNAELVMYQTSGDVTGDDRDVVGYAGVLIQ